MKSYIINNSQFIGTGRILKDNVLQVIGLDDIKQFKLNNLLPVFFNKEGIDICVVGTIINNTITVTAASFIDIANVIDLDTDEFPRKVFILPKEDLLVSFNGNTKIGNATIQEQNYRFEFIEKEDAILYPIYLETEAVADVTNTVTHKIKPLL